VQSAGRIARESFGAGELGHDEAAATQAANHAAKNGIRDAGHRREDRGGAYGATADCEFRRKHN
jgi:hypothetical protein